MRLGSGGMTVDVSPFGAMITAARFDLGNGRVVAPFFENPWRSDPRELTDFERNLGAEWACVPFGLPDISQHLPEDWRIAPAGDDWNRLIHGHGSHSAWVLDRTGPDSVVAHIEYPSTTPIERVVRSVRIDPGTPSLHLSLRIEMRKASWIALGVHPVFDLSGCRPGSCRLDLAGTPDAWSFPVDVEPGRSRFAADQRGVPLTRMRCTDGSMIDATRLPLDSATEDLLLLTDPGGEVVLAVPERGFQVAVGWNVRDLPCCSLWYSNGGRDFPPWDGRVCAIGIEPTVAAFDLGQPHSLSSDTPLARAGIPTAVWMIPEESWETSYSIRVAPLGPAQIDDGRRG